MKFRRKLLAVFALTVLLCAAAVAWLIAYFARRNFEDASEQRSTALIVRVDREFNQRKAAVLRRVENIAATPTALRMAVSLNRGPVDYGEYLNEARNLADAQQLDFLDFADDQGTILSSAELPAKFGYKTVLPAGDPLGVFFQQEDLPNGSVLGLCAMRKVTVADKALFVIGGQRIDRSFVAGLDMPPGMRALLYQPRGPASDAPQLIDSFGSTPPAAPLLPLIEQVRNDTGQNSGVVRWSTDPADAEIVRVIPFFGIDRDLLGALLLTDSLRPYLQLRRQIGSTALFIGSAGILIAIVLSGWAATRITRPVDQLVAAARKVAAGDWSTQVQISSADELSDLAQSFNDMTRELLDQKQRLVQAERVAAWRELARRLAHELKNPLFPLQLTVENLVRAREQNPEQFDEVFRESSATLLTEIANLKSIVSRFSEFSKMPPPRFQRVQVNDIAQDSFRVFQPQLTASERAPIQSQLGLAQSIDPIAGDPELLHRAFCNLISNAIDAMPHGGTLSLRTLQEGEHVVVEVGDTGSGLTPDERDRLFTPYFTTKPHGTGLVLAIVQSIVSDHGGRISVDSKQGGGTVFRIELARNFDKLQPSNG